MQRLRLLAPPTTQRYPSNQIPLYITMVIHPAMYHYGCDLGYCYLDKTDIHFLSKVLL